MGMADPMALGYDAYAMVGLKVASGHDPQKAAHYFRDRDEVTYVIFVAGRYDLLIEVICETHDQLALFLREHCYSRDDLASVEPMVGLAMYKNMLKWGQP
jgi:Lrp/AsnC family transcriptional regulator for asnA, asnC and gidA